MLISEPFPSPSCWRQLTRRTAEHREAAALGPTWGGQHYPGPVDSRARPGMVTALRGACGLVGQARAVSTARDLQINSPEACGWAEGSRL